MSQSVMPPPSYTYTLDSWSCKTYLDKYVTQYINIPLTETGGSMIAWLSKFYYSTHIQWILTLCLLGSCWRDRWDARDPCSPTARRESRWHGWQSPRSRSCWSASRNPSARWRGGSGPSICHRWPARNYARVWMLWN